MKSKPWTFNPTHGSSLAGWIMARGIDTVPRAYVELHTFLPFTLTKPSAPSLTMMYVLLIPHKHTHTHQLTEKHAALHDSLDIGVCMSSRMPCQVVCVCVHGQQPGHVSHTLYACLCECVCSAGVRLSICVSCLQPLPCTAGTLL